MIFCICLLSCLFVAVNLSCGERFSKFRTSRNPNGWLVECGVCSVSDCIVAGDGLYSDNSHICCAAIHNGTIVSFG